MVRVSLRDSGRQIVDILIKSETISKIAVEYVKAVFGSYFSAAAARGLFAYMVKIQPEVAAAIHEAIEKATENQYQIVSAWKFSTSPLKKAKKQNLTA